MAGARNVISGNDSDGIGIFLDGASGNLVLGNFIGTDVTGMAALGNNLNGVSILEGASSNTIRGNAIHSNAGLGIDLGGDGVTPNDAGDGDGGANTLQNFPVVQTVEAGANTRLVGTLNSTPNGTYTVDFYASAAADPSGFGEGQRWLGAITVHTDAAGTASFDVVVTAVTTLGEFVSSTATDAAGNTSEFSGSREIQFHPVQIDVMPQSTRNTVNLHENGVIPVAILTTPGFDASQVNPASVEFAGASAVQSALEDVDGDGDLDMILHFRVQETNLLDLYGQLLLDDVAENGVLDNVHQRLSANLTGQTVDEVFFAGTDDLDIFLAGKNLRDFLEALAASR